MHAKIAVCPRKPVHWLRNNKDVFHLHIKVNDANVRNRFAGKTCKAVPFLLSFDHAQARAYSSSDTGSPQTVCPLLGRGLMPICAKPLLGAAPCHASRRAESARHLHASAAAQVRLFPDNSPRHSSPVGFARLCVYANDCVHPAQIPHHKPGNRIAALRPTPTYSPTHPI